MHITLFNVKYSPNLGDGLLSECLELELKSIDSSMVLTTLDLAGRTKYGEGLSGRRHILAALGMLPYALRTTFTSFVLRRLAKRRLTPHWRCALIDSDAAIIGGGNLFADSDLNFPIKISCALKLIRERGIPVAVHSVGVADHWSKRGRELFAEGLRSACLTDATVRDGRSQTIWATLLGPYNIAPAGLAPDPGLLTAKHFPAKPSSLNKPVAFGLTHPVALAYHTSNKVPPSEMNSWTLQLIKGLVWTGFEVALFANGSPEDQSYLKQIWQQLSPSISKRVSLVNRFPSPSLLATFISDCQLIISHRMHACIPAYSYGVPAIGLKWDPKLDSFFDLSGRPEYLANPATTTTEEMLALVRLAISTPIEQCRKLHLIEKCEQSIRRLFDVIKKDLSCADAK